MDDGHTPWCLGFESEALSGWPGTDWIEGLTLRIGARASSMRWTISPPTHPAAG